MTGPLSGRSHPWQVADDPEFRPILKHGVDKPSVGVDRRALAPAIQREGLRRAASDRDRPELPFFPTHERLDEVEDVLAVRRPGNSRD